jgi:hypothetical protein
MISTAISLSSSPFFFVLSSFFLFSRYRLTRSNPPRAKVTPCLWGEIDQVFNGKVNTGMSVLGKKISHCTSDPFLFAHVCIKGIVESAKLKFDEYYGKLREVNTFKASFFSPSTFFILLLFELNFFYFPAHWFHRDVVSPLAMYFCFFLLFGRVVYWPSLVSIALGWPKKSRYAAKSSFRKRTAAFDWVVSSYHGWWVGRMDAGCIRALT